MILAKLDALLERGADALEGLGHNLARDGGFRSQVAEELVEDAAFLRRLTPTKVVARARGEQPPEQPRPTPPAAAEAPQPAQPAQATMTAEPATRPSTKPATPPKPRRGRKGPNPFLVVGAAFATGILVAKLIDWRGYAHPRY